MQRRRFFAARPAQQLPGQRVELAVQVRKSGGAAPAAPTPGPVEPVGPVLSWVSPDEGLAGHVQRFPGNELSFEVVPSDDGLIHVKPMWWDVLPEVITGWRGTPWRMTVDDVPLPMAGPGWQCVLIECVVSVWETPPPACYTGFVTGVAPERVAWELAWEPPHDGTAPMIGPGNIDWGHAVSASGHVARVSGAALMVYPVWQGGGLDTRETLTATALVDGKAVGSLQFVAIHVGW